MVKDPKDGGFIGGKRNGITQFSETTLRHYWSNWLHQMNDADMEICGCETCCRTNDLHTAMKGKRRKLIKEASDQLMGMENQADKDEFEKKVNKYKEEVLTEDGKSHKYDQGWDAAENYGCGVKIDIDGKSFPHYSCILRNCAECIETATPLQRLS